MKRPDGWVVEEYITEGAHLMEDGKAVDYEDASVGRYTGVFWFEYLDGRQTRRYTLKTAPKWLLSLYREATGRKTRRAR